MEFSRVSVVKRVLFVALGVSLLLYLGVSIIYRTGVIQKKVKEIVEVELSKAFRREIRVGSISGNLLTSARLRDVQIASRGDLTGGTLMTVETLEARYSLISTAKLKGDILGAMDLVTLEGVRLDVVRTKEDYWNLLDFLLPPPLPEGVTPPPVTFKGRIIMTNVEGSFRDEKGWAPTPLSVPFYDEFTDVSCALDFANLNEVPMLISGRFKRDNTPISLNGMLNASNAQYKFYVNVPKLDTQHWGSYVFPLEGFTLYDDVVAVQGTLTSKYPFPKNDVPFYYDLNTTFNDLTFKLPFFDVPLKNLRGTMKVHNTKTPSLEFFNMKGSVQGVSFTGNGPIELHNQKINMSFRTSQFDLPALKTLFPVLKMWQFSGDGKTSFSIVGDLTKPVIKGDLFINQTETYELRPENLTLAYKIYDQILDFTLQRGQLFGGAFTGKGQINYQEKTPSFSIDLQNEAMQFHTIFPKLSDHLSPTINMQTRVAGTWDLFTINMRADGPELSIYNQDISQFSANMRVKDHKDIEVQKALAVMTLGGSVTLKGDIINLTEVGLDYDIKDLNMLDVDPESQGSETGLFEARGRVETSLGKTLFSSPQTAISASSEFSLWGGAYYGQKIERIIGKFNYDKSDIQIEDLRVLSGPSEMNLRGTFSQLSPERLYIDLKNWRLDESRLIQSKIPASIQPFSAVLSGNLSFNSPKNKDQLIIDTNLQFKDLVLRDQSFSEGQLRSTWSKNQLEIRHLEIKDDTSQLMIDGRYFADKKVDLRIKKGSEFDLKYLRPYLSADQEIAGTLKVNGKIKGDYRSPDFQVDVQAKKAIWNNLNWDLIQGSIGRSKGNLILNQVLLTEAASQYQFNGSVDLESLKNLESLAFDDVVYDLDIQLKDVSMKKLARTLENIYREYLASPKSLELKVPDEKIKNSNIGSFGIQDPFLEKSGRKLYTNYSESNSIGFLNEIYKRYQGDALQGEQSWASFVNGQVSGRLRAKSEKGKPNILESKLEFLDVQLTQLRSKKMTLETWTLPKQIKIDIALSQGKWMSSDFEEMYFSGAYLNSGDLKILGTRMNIGGTMIQNGIRGSFPIAGYWDKKKQKMPMNLMFEFERDEINMLTLLTPFVDKIESQGNVQLSLKGTLESPVLSSKKSLLKNTVVHFNQEKTFFRSPLKLRENRLLIKNNVMSLQNFIVDWKGEDTRRKLTNYLHTNTLVFNGKISLEDLNFLNPESIIFNLDLSLNPTFLTLNLEDLMHGDMALGKINMKGPYTIGLTEESTAKLRASIGTEEEKGPLISGSLALSDGRINFPVIGKNNAKPSFLLDISAQIKQGVYIEGGVFGRGLFNLANNFYLELKETTEPLTVRGSMNLMKIDQALIIEEGSISFFDKVFSLMKEKQQRQFFKDHPEDVGENTLAFITEFPKGMDKRKLIPVLDFKAVTFIEEELAGPQIPSENISSISPISYKGLVLIFNGRIDEMDTALIAEEYDTNNPLSGNLNPQLIRRQPLNFSSTEADKESLDMLRLILPSFMISDQGQAQWDKMGAQQANVFFRSTIRPYEKRLARRVGLYDLRVEYDVGRSLFAREDPSLSQRSNLLGMNMVADIMDDKLFLRVKTDIDLNSETQQSAEGLKLTEVELTYYFTQNFSMNLANISDYYENRDFSPRLSLKLTHEF